MPDWTFTIDHAQRRFSRQRIGVALGGSDLIDYRVATEHVFLCPVTKTLMLGPVCLYSAWDTSSSGENAKWVKSDWSNNSAVKDYDQSGSGHRKFMVGEKDITLQSTNALAKNTGMVIQLLNYNNGSNGVILECGWSNTAGSLSNDIGIRVYAGLNCEVWKGSKIIATGSLAPSAGAVQNQTLTILLIPGRHKELLVLNAFGESGFRAIFDDIAEDASDPTITPATKFWMRQPDVSTNILATPIKYKTSGTAFSSLYTMAEAPDNTDTLETYTNDAFAGGAGQTFRIYGDQSYRTSNTDAVTCSLYNAAAGAAFTANGSNKDCRLRLVLSGNGDSTPFVYFAEMGYQGRAAVTDDSESFDLTPYVTEFSLEVPDGGGPSARVVIQATEEVRAGVAGLFTQFNRPFLIQCGTSTVLNGRTSPPKYERRRNPDAEMIEFTITSTLEALKQFRFRDRKALDGMLVSHATAECAVRFILRQIGVQDSAMSLETSTVRIGEYAPSVCGSPLSFIDVGETAFEALERIIQDYLGGWFWDAVPNVGGVDFTLKSDATITGAASVAEVFWTTAESVTADITDFPHRHVIRNMTVERVEPECNEIIMTGFDARSETPIQVVKRDTNAQDPTLAPSDRPETWTGDARLMAIANKQLSTQSILNDAVLVVAAKLFSVRIIEQFESEWLLQNQSTGLPAWRGHKITVDGIDRIVASASMTAIKVNSDFQWIPTRYVVSNINGRTAGKTAAEIAARERQIRRDGLVQRRNSAGLTIQTKGKLTVIT